MLCRGRSRVYVLLFTSFFIICLWVSFLPEQQAVKEVTKLYAVDQVPLILFWTKIFGIDGPSGTTCLPLRCTFVNNRSALADADAVVFHGNDVWLNDLAKRTSEEQRFVFWTMETPYGFRKGQLRFVDNNPLPHNYFNWTMTLSSKSDVHHPYGGYWLSPDIARMSNITPENLSFSDEDINWTRKKKAIFWLVSNCETPSKRETAVQRLSKFVQVDVAGKCGDNHSRCEGDCDRKIPEYSFYIAIENAVCDDYISEKYWTRYHLLSIPIVMRRRIYERHIPPGSFIAMDDYASPGLMGMHLEYLMNNQSAYLEYFGWRKKGWARAFNTKDYLLGPCALCKKLLDNDAKEKTYSDVSDWYMKALQCEGDEFAMNWK